MKPEFIATQAPKQNSFENFWQMVLEKEVSWTGGFGKDKNFIVFLGEGDRDADRPGGEQQEEGRPVLAWRAEQDSDYQWLHRARQINNIFDSPFLY